MLSTNQELVHKQESFHIKQDDKFFSKLLSKETSAITGNPSFRVYYGDVSGAVPFTWETQPGTPKHALSDSGSLPPLTPPPSAAYNNSRVSISSSKGLNNSSIDIQPSRGSSNFLIMRALVMRIVSTLKKNNNKNKNKNMYSRRHHHHHHVQLSPSYCSSSLSLSSPSSSSSQHSPSNYVSDFYGKRGSWSVCFGLGKSNTMKENMFSIINRGSD